MTVATTREPKRVMSAEQTEEMLRKERLVLTERIKGRSFYSIEKQYGIHNPDRIFRRAIARDENASFRRAEAIRVEEMRLDELQSGIWDKALRGEPRAVEVALKVLERRARMGGLDFADMISGQLVEVEQAKVRLMATALVTALNAINATEEQRRAATRAFLGELRSLQAEERPALTFGPALDPADEDLL